MNKWDGRFLELAELVSTWSQDPSTKCGSVITKGKRIVSMGFNGFPAGCKDDCYDDRERKMMRVLHAEVNAILFAGQDLTDCTIYVHPFQPCSNCMAMIIQSGITKVITRTAPADKLDRWGDNFAESQRLADEAGIELVIVYNERRKPVIHTVPEWVYFRDRMPTNDHPMNLLCRDKKGVEYMYNWYIDEDEMVDDGTLVSWLDRKS